MSKYNRYSFTNPDFRPSILSLPRINSEGMSTRNQFDTESDPDDEDGNRQNSGATILVPVFDDTPPRIILDTAIALVEATSGELLLVKVVAVPKQTPLELTEDILDGHRRQLATALDELPETERPTRGVVRVGHKLERIIASAVTEHGVSAIAIGQPESSADSAYRPVRPPLVEAVGTDADCDLVAGIEAADYSDVASILVPIAGGPHSEFAIRFAQVLATYHDAWIELLHVIPEDASDDRVAEGERYLSRGLERIEDQETADTWLLENDDVAATIIEQSAYYDVTVIGAPQKGRLRQFVAGATTADVERGAKNTVLTVRKNRNDDSRVRRWLGRGT